MTDYLFVVPARQGSARCPQKNLRLLSGRSLVNHAMACADAVLDALRPRSGTLVLTTDDPVVAARQKTHRGRHPWHLRRRPPGVRGDQPIDVVLRDIAECYGTPRRGWVLLQPTTPQRTVADVMVAVGLLESTGAAQVVTVHAAGPHLWRRNGVAYVYRSIERWPPLPTVVCETEPVIDVDTEDDWARLVQEWAP